MTTQTASPDALIFYRPSRDFYALSWRINPVAGEIIDTMQCEVWIDTSPFFDSINIKKYTESSSDVKNFQDGYLYKSYSFLDRDLFQDVNYYAKVRVNSTLYVSDWSETIYFNLYKNTWYDDTRLLKALLPDDSIYCKQGITTSGKIIEAYAREIQDLKKETRQIRNNVNYKKCQDEDLYDVLGILLGIYRNTNRPFIEYKRELLCFWEAFLESGTESAIKKITKTILGQECVIKKVRDTHGWIVHDTQDLPYVELDDAYENSSAHFYAYDSNNTTLVPTIRPNSRTGRGLGVILKIYNPFNLPTRHVLIESLVEKLKPINVTVYYEYYKFDGISSMYWGGSSGWGSGYWGEGSQDGSVRWLKYTPID